jgi:hypothetical protein
MACLRVMGFVQMLSVPRFGFDNVRSGWQVCPHTDVSASKNAAKCTKVRFGGPHRSILRWTRTTAMGRSCHSTPRADSHRCCAMHISTLRAESGHSLRSPQMAAVRDKRAIHPHATSRKMHETAARLYEQMGTAMGTVMVMVMVMAAAMPPAKLLIMEMAA